MPPCMTSHLDCSQAPHWYGSRVLMSAHLERQCSLIQRHLLLLLLLLLMLVLIGTCQA